GKIPDADRWYFSLITDLADQLKLELDIEAWWQQMPNKSTATQKFNLFLRRIVLEKIKHPIVIFVDEIDMTLGLNFTDDFFAVIRTIYNDRVQERPYRRLTFVLLGVATPDELIKDNTRTPFNIGMEIPLNDFTEDECLPFRQALQTVYPEQGDHYFDQIYSWTRGHPYLTQKLCEAVLKRRALQADGVYPSLVSDLVRELFLAAESRAESNLQFVQSRVVSDSYAQEMLRTYKRILRPGSPVSDDKQSLPITRLKLYGLILAKHGQLEVRNKLYAQAFDAAWADEILKSLGLGLGDKYKILYRISEEGPVTVYLAEKKDSAPAQTLALKVLHLPKNTDEDGWIRYAEHLENTARKVAEAHHTNIVEIFDIGWSDEKTLYIAMEYVPTGSLHRRLNAGPLPRNEAIEVIKQVGAALSCAHHQSIFHLAVNPGDILLDRRGETLRVVLTDFGFARFLLEPSYPSSPSNSVILTPHYVAPEYKDKANPLSPALDIYGLGVTLFEMLVGKLPPIRQPDEPLPTLSDGLPRQYTFFDEVTSRATAANPHDRYPSVAAFIEAVEEANQLAEQFEQTEQKKRAASIIDAAQIYMQSGSYDYEKALPMIEAALDTYPDYLDALTLRGRIRLQQGQIAAALTDYQKAYEKGPDLASEVGQEYLQILSRMGENAWEQQHYAEAVTHYRTIRRTLAAYPEKTDFMEQMELQALGKLIEYEQHKIATAQTEIDRLQTSSVSNRDDIFQPYVMIDQAYRSLIGLEPDQQIWLIHRKSNLKAQALLRVKLANEALQKAEPDHTTALKHYHAIRDIEKTDYPELSQELDLDLKQTIEDLRRIVDYTGKYNQFLEYTQLQDHQTALDYLKQEFIKTGNYEYKEVARWLWGLSHLVKEGDFPKEWNILPAFRPLSDRLVQLKQGQIERLKDQLKPWSPANISDTIEAKKQKLQECEDEVVQSIGGLLEQAVKNGVAAQSEIEVCRGDLNEIRQKIQQQREAFLKLDTHVTANLVEDWLQKIHSAEAILTRGDSIKDIPDYLRRVESEQQTIENDPAFEVLQNLQAAILKIEADILHVKLRIKRRLVGILINDIGRRDDELVKVKKEADAVEARLKQELANLTGVLTATRGELDQEKAKPNLAQRELEDVRKGRRFALVALIPALVFGGVIGLLIAVILQPEFVSMTLLTTIFVIAVITVITFWGGWIYFNNRNQ
ncbi:MAG: AAA-like domain-containing protein, partial [Anaerolineae bacterium]|nr:AAA-like domain-containing protein [Anaerolineae bacterium]